MISSIKFDQQLDLGFIFLSSTLILLAFYFTCSFCVSNVFFSVVMFSVVDVQIIVRQK